MKPNVAVSILVIAGVMLLGGAPAAAQAPDLAAPKSASGPPPARPYAEAVATAARNLFKAIPLPPGDGKVEIVIDPLLDGATGIHTVAAADMGRRLIDIAGREFPRLAIVDFTPEALGRKPLLLIGSITLLQDAGQATATPAPRPYAIWYTVADTKTNEVVAKSNARATADGVDAAPTPSEADSPVWRKDATALAYLDSCRNVKVGEKLRPAYADQLTAAAVIANAKRAYDSGRTQQALDLYRKALAMPDGRQLRVLNGIYESLARLGQRKDAEQAFGEVVDYGLENRDLAVMLLFRTGTARFVESPQARTYPMWLGQIATRAAARQSCLEVVGHTSPTGPVAVNDRLSQLRAEYVRDRLSAVSRRLQQRMVARGVGSRENIIGSGKDDASDAVDRRVAFTVLSCS